MAAVLFTCAGQRVDIVTAFGRAGAFTVAADANPLAPALYHADRYALVPLTDLDQLDLARRRDELEATVLLPAADVVEAMADKYLTHVFLEERGIPSPPTWLPEDVPADVSFPLLVKAREGFGSRHIYKARDRRELDFFLGYTPVPSIVQAVCPGEEFSIDVFCDFDGRCLNAIPRTMIESKGGESIKGMTLKDPVLIEAGRRVAETAGLAGPANVQVFRDEDDICRVTDVNPRFGGGFPLPTAAGSGYPELALALARGERPEPRVGDFREGVVMTRFFSHVCLTAGDDGTLELFAEDAPQPISERVD